MRRTQQEAREMRRNILISIVREALYFPEESKKEIIRSISDARNDEELNEALTNSLEPVSKPLDHFNLANT